MERNKTLTMKFKDKEQVLHVTEDELNQLLSLEGDEQRRLLINLWARDALEEQNRMTQKCIDRMNNLLKN